MVESELLDTAPGRNPGRTAPPPVVALVCSAGGLDAVQRVLRPLPAAFPAALIVLQHQAPEQSSHLREILARNCRFPVRTAHHGEGLLAGTVYVVPAGQHAVVTTVNTIVLIPSDGTPPYRPSADLLLTSLALTAGDRTVGVILSGSGHDGAVGAAAIHGAGGIVIASDHDTSAWFDMPQAAIQRDDAVDYVVPVDDIPALLLALLSS